MLDPKPIAATGNYLGFRWNFSSEQEREAWTNARKATATAYGTPVTSTVAIATKGVFAEAVLGRANSAEKIDLTRFWDWKDSPIQITPADIAPVSTASRAQNLDTKVAPLGASEARFTPLVAMPDPAGLQTAQASPTANLFRDMSGINTVTQVLTKGIEATVSNDKAAGERGQEALKTATEHLQKMQQLANSRRQGGRVRGHRRSRQPQRPRRHDEPGQGRGGQEATPPHHPSNRTRGPPRPLRRGPRARAGLRRLPPHPQMIKIRSWRNGNGHHQSNDGSSCFVKLA
ncbi:hypothetical protein ACIRSU_02510 [Streptomyces sp. NPDC101160]|uniref:hypothetical protein n=1 Tax=Streptomyces sp. NPDC101160 TaxID=3366118 RepID=UPI003805B661